MHKKNEKNTAIVNDWINSKEYWEQRFANGDWEKWNGGGQSRFFAEVAYKLFPQFLKDDLLRNEWEVMDIGCAEGEGTAFWAKQFPGCHFTGADFSEAAIEIARGRFQNCNWQVHDVYDEIPKVDVLISSNTLEHLVEPKEILKSMCRSAEKYVVLLVPYEDVSETEEHINIFDGEFFPMEVEACFLECFKVMDCTSVNGTYWLGKQILLVYTNIEYKKNILTVQDLYRSICADIDDERILFRDKANELEDRNRVLSDEVNHLETESNKKIQHLETELNNSRIQNEENLNQLNAAQESIDELNRKVKEQADELNKKERVISAALQQCIRMTESSLFKMVHMANRAKYQGRNQDKAERKKFRKWLLSKTKGSGGDADHRYNPLYSIIDILKGNVNNNSAAVMDYETPLGQHLQKESVFLDSGIGDSREIEEIRNLIKTRKYKGILVYPHVVYWEPLQTPQQLLRAFAKCGWLCFFCEHPNIKDAYREVEENVIIVHERELLHAIDDNEVVVLLTWLGSLAFVDRIKNKKIWYHILDKLDLFPYYDQGYECIHKQWVQQATTVSYVATPLLECLADRSDAVYLPNGVNPEEFLNIHQDYVPDDMKAIVNTGHKIIGYYGYLAEWMDYGMVRQAALARPEYEFVFIGKAIYDTSEFEGVSNIHLLGLKQYKELSDYAKFFDIATIPFVINEQMDCVSPIKFYEYCALGLPVITSRMKEMEKQVCEFVRCVNGIDEYLFYLDKFVQSDIKQMADQNAPKIAEDNTWKARAQRVIGEFDKSLDTILSQQYDKFDVIILGVIDYDFRFQRPQHFAVRFAQNGHRVFYVNANHYNKNSTSKLRENLYIVNLYNEKSTAIHLTDWENEQSELKAQLRELLNQYCIRDAITIVDYPNWIYAAEFLRKDYGFKIVTDYMDDYTGFLNPAEDLVRVNCEKLLKASDKIIASSQFLADIASKYKDDITIVRNGTEFEHFHQAYGTVNHNRKIIGYYGAIAEWFDCKKVLYLAKNLPDCDIVLVGHVTQWKRELSGCSNIKLLGEKAYRDLPEFLKEFDVCLIPFDTSTDLIKATNPVKFYEYLSAGKKVVATEIPELEPFKDQYVYMSNDDEQFLKYVKLCLDGTDSLAETERCISFAKENDWQSRFEVFEQACKTAVPSISVIVLTYNNLEINKLCIESIQNKTAYPNYELIVVDNNSTDGTQEYLRDLPDRDGRIKVILNTENKGFAAGNNDGIKTAKGDYVVLLNNDTVVTRGWLTAMSKHLENQQDLGMCGPVTNSIGNEAKIEVLYHSRKEMERFAYHYTTEHICEQYKNVKVLALFCTMIKRAVINECGLLDEQYGIGMFEDDDYAENVKSKRYKITIAEDAFIHHFESVSFKKLQDEKFKQLYEENKRKFEEKWNKKWTMHQKRAGVEQSTNADAHI